VFLRQADTLPTLACLSSCSTSPTFFALNTGNINTGNINTSNINTSNINTGNINTSNINTGNLNTGNLNTGNLNTGNLNTGNMRRECFCNTTGQSRAELDYAQRMLVLFSYYSAEDPRFCCTKYRQQGRLQTVHEHSP
jgi:hypothetical protein